ncbi:MAG: methyltransferase [Elusimicrobia bacterium RIFOXYD2_FULL_34_15]|nr:MAG: methyltransferase [Elusimicrobia bacterium RIFOXYD2_FULL_34_15]
MVDLKLISENLISGKAAKVKELVQQALSEGIEPSKILKEGLIAGMDTVGVKFKAGEFYIPEVLIAARAMHSGMEILKPQLIKSGAKSSGRFAVGTVKGDVHDIGKNLVAMMMEGAGFEVLDLGTDVSSDKFVDAVKNKNIEVLGMSSLLTTTMPMMKETIDALAANGLKGKVKTIIGGAPVTQNYADEIGADAYSTDAASAVDKVKALLK